jgi:hypothetical protein
MFSIFNHPLDIDSWTKQTEENMFTLFALFLFALFLIYLFLSFSLSLSFLLTAIRSAACSWSPSLAWFASLARLARLTLLALPTSLALLAIRTPLTPLAPHSFAPFVSHITAFAAEPIAFRLD